MLFDVYLFADYSGALDRNAQRSAIRLAQALPKDKPKIVESRLTREELISEFVCRLQKADRSGMRLCFGQDHQYGIPYALAQELSLGRLAWRDAIRALVEGSYGDGAPGLAHPRIFAAMFNTWLTALGGQPYFYSATKAALYGVPARDPRGGDASVYRLTELCRSGSGTGAPKPFNRVGDNGSVGGQSILGMTAIEELLRRCEREGIRVAVWPFDGLSITDKLYADAHVMIEPYPSAVRAATVAQSDEADALASAAHLRDSDAQGALGELLDLSNLDAADAEAARFEGWIFSHQPQVRRTRRGQPKHVLQPTAAARPL